MIDDAEFHQQLGRRTLDACQAKMPFERAVEIAEHGVERLGIGRQEGHLDLIADFEPGKMHERQADGAFEFARRFEHEAAIGGRDDAFDGVADLRRKIIPAIVARNPMRRARRMLDAHHLRRRFFVFRWFSAFGGFWFCFCFTGGGFLRCLFHAARL